jgi:hypothetical protein
LDNRHRRYPGEQIPGKFLLAALQDFDRYMDVGFCVETLI